MTALPQDVAPDLGQENAQLRTELRAARDRQNASAEILRAIAGTPGDAGRALQQIAETSARLFGAPSVSIQLVENGKWGQAYRFGDSAQRIRSAVPLANIQVGGHNMPGAVVGQNKQFHIPDLDHLDASFADWPGLPHARAAGTRTMCGTPLRHEGNAIGALIILRDRLAPFTDDELALLQSFADQAVIAIENAKLFNETQQALARQTATSEILRVISRSPTDVKPVFDAIVLASVRLFGCHRAFFLRCDGATYSREAIATPEGLLAERGSVRAPIDPDANFPSRAMVEKKTLHLPDWSLIDLPEHERLIHEKHGVNSALYLPLLREGECIALLVLGGTRPGMFGESEIALAESFRDQALIAIENVRLFNETQEALERQNASADILRTIASTPGDAEQALNQIAETCARLFGAPSATIHIAEGDGWARTIRFGASSERVGAGVPASQLRIGGRNMPGTIVAENRQVHIPDTDNVDPAIADWPGLPYVREAGTRSLSGSPLRREGKAIGALIVYRDRLAPFTAEELAVQQTFADQAAIAIENARLFNETKEALERQHATSEVLQVIGNSVADTAPVFEKILDSCQNLFATEQLGVFLARDGQAHVAAWRGGAFEAMIAAFPKPLEQTATGLAIERRNVLSIANAAAMTDMPPAVRDIYKRIGDFSAVWAPMLRDGRGVGVIVALREPPRPFSEREISLLRTFADQAVIAIENTRLFNETREALERQTATADILKVIASSPDDVQPVFEAIAESAKRLSGGHSAVVTRVVDDNLHLAAFTAGSEAGDRELHSSFPRPRSSSEIHSRVAAAGTLAFRTDIENDPDISQAVKELARARGYRSILVVPMLREGVAIGTIGVSRREPGPFANHIVGLLETFADQAVIAIENTRLFNETKEALERQTATADILKVIASSPEDVQPVFEAIATSANRLVGGFSSTVFRFIDGLAHLKAFTPTTPAADDVLRATFPRPVADFPPFQMAQAGKVTQVPDTEALSDDILEISRARGFRSMLFAPLMNDAVSIGFIAVTRAQPGNFTDHHVQLLRTFADQAVIAIENARLFDEVQAKTADLSESLQQQTATADVLKVISRSAFDLQVVLDTLVESAARLCEADMAAITRQNGDEYFRAGSYGFTSEWMDYVKDIPVRPERTTITGRTLLEGKVIHVPDVHADLHYTFSESQKLSGDPCTFLGVPLLREGKPVGALVLVRRAVRPFTDKQVELVTTFADQAVIAIENVRLFDEVQAKTRELAETLEYQTATSEVLNVISRSPNNLQPVMDTIVHTAQRLCASEYALILQRGGDGFYRIIGHANAHREFLAWLEDHPVSEGDGTAVAIAAAEKRTIHLPDALADPRFTDLRRQRLSKARTMLAVPLMRETEVIGVVFLARTEIRPFSDKQVELVTSFADQAVIAIENVRLFDEVQAKTRDLEESLQQQTATSEVLRVISSSPGELAPVFETMLENATRVCGAEFGSMNLVEDGWVRQAALYNAPPAFAAARANAVRRPQPRTALAIAIESKQVLHVADVRTTPPYLEGAQSTVELAELGGARTIVVVPMLRENEVIGVITVYRKEVRLFDDKQIDLLSNFAKQAVIAIENARLLGELRQRTADLSKSLDELRTAQGRLIQTEKLASLGQLTAGIAHEIKNPLNFVNNFSALSAELTGELNDVLKSATLSDKMRMEVDELTGLLKDNLEKVVQHGKRADSIVKNMLLHSREGSGDHRPADINALLDESLNLAYHGARAEKPQFNVTLRRNFDESAGTIEVFPQEITRVFLNLISNGFYAVTKRRAENGGSGFEPVVSATTRSLGDSVEIRIRDNGTGIPDEVKEKMFNPFFTTKPAGEGTGLGLSMSHDIIVKQHGGRIEVETEPGHFTEFTIVLPRTSNFPNKDRGQT